MKWFSWGRAALLVPAFYLFWCVPYGAFTIYNAPENPAEMSRSNPARPKGSEWHRLHDAHYAETNRGQNWLLGPPAVAGIIIIFGGAAVGLLQAWFELAPPEPEPEWRKIAAWADTAEAHGRDSQLVQSLRGLAAEMKENS